MRKIRREPIFGAYFDFLTTEYEMKRVHLSQDGWDKKWAPSIAFASARAGVLARYDVRDSCLDVFLFDIRRSGPFPKAASQVKTNMAYPLNAAIYLIDPSQMIGPWERAGSAVLEGNGSFESYVSDAASKLHSFADDLLRGDFRRAQQMETAVQMILKDRERSLE